MEGEKRVNDRRDCIALNKQRVMEKEVASMNKKVDRLMLNSDINKLSLQSMSIAFREYVKTNSDTHSKLFKRTETLNIDQARIETEIKGHLLQEDKDDANHKHSQAFVVSLAAIGISLAAMLILAAKGAKSYILHFIR
jgi:L-lactate utilization protein LutC